MREIFPVHCIDFYFEEQPFKTLFVTAICQTVVLKVGKFSIKVSYL